MKKQVNIQHVLSLVRSKENSFGSHFPEYVEYWDYDKNGTISPYEISYRSNYKFWFKCEYEGKTYSYQKIPNNLNW